MKKIYLVAILALTILTAGAQDIHYTQFYNSPLTTNPALTGVVPGAYRVSLIYRNQWFSGVNNGFFNSPYQTPSVSFDMPIVLKNKDAIGVGAVLLYDAAGAGSISTFTGQVSASYIKHLGTNHQLSAGFQVGFTQVKLNTSDAHFASQYQGNDYNPNIASGIGLQPNRNYVNLNFGLLYYGKLTSKISLYAGGSIFNTTTPKDNLTTDQSKKDLSIRGNINAGMDFTIGRRFHILPSALWMRQSNQNQLNTGLGFGYDVNMRTNITLGIYNRVNDVLNADHQVDAAILYAGFQIKGFKLGASYDFTVSQFSQAGGGTGGLEISLTYIGLPKIYSLKEIMFCPRF
jgi:type IX secretion system PorP/SprF family membrane protein